MPQHNGTQQPTVYAGITPTVFRLVSSPESKVQFLPATPENTIRVVTSELGSTAGEIELFVAIAKGESSLDPQAVGYAGAFYGLFQIYIGTWASHGCVGDIFSPIDNTVCAVKIQRVSGWNQWEYYTKKLFNL